MERHQPDNTGIHMYEDKITKFEGSLIAEQKVLLGGKLDKHSSDKDIFKAMMIDTYQHSLVKLFNKKHEFEDEQKVIEKLKSYTQNLS